MITLRHYQGKKIGVVGLGKSGIATVASLTASECDVYVWDDSEEKRRTFWQSSASVKTHMHEPQTWPWDRLNALVLSPGIALTHPEPHYTVRMAQEADVRVIGDIELFCEAQHNAQKIAVSGTNGKSTTTSLIAHILQSAGRKAAAGGNLGTPALALPPFGSEGCYVLELSSYQLDLVQSAHFNVSLLLNITPDHIDRHGSMEGYVTAKAHIFDRQNRYDFALVGIDDDYSRSVYAELKQKSKAQIMAISRQNPLKQGVFVDKEGMLHDKIDPKNPAAIRVYDIINLTGRHNWQNAAFAYAACKAYGLTTRDIEKGLRSYPGLRHRLQIVATIHGVRFINDSKATNADAASHALAPFSHVYWIAGGKPKEGGIESLAKYFDGVSHAFLIGEAESAFAKTLEGRVPYTLCGTLANAFEAAARQAFADRRQNAVVLLSPACASFDQWKSFEERGDAFCKMVEDLLDKVVSGRK
jgi:UDP-N-acetylmuramoylalanine--D-glutamate ligase